MQLVAFFKPWTWVETVFLEYFDEFLMCKKWENAVGIVLFRGETKTKKKLLLIKKNSTDKKK